MATGDLLPIINRLLEQVDANHDDVMRCLNGDPADPSKPGMNGRLASVERDMSIAKKAIALSLGGLAAFIWDMIKKKTGIV